ncbi:MAG: hypothetical protein ACRC3B_11935, partial [Bacteroidia bacterium]
MEKFTGFAGVMSVECKVLNEKVSLRASLGVVNDRCSLTIAQNDSKTHSSCQVEQNTPLLSGRAKHTALVRSSKTHPSCQVEQNTPLLSGRAKHTALVRSIS